MRAGILAFGAHVPDQKVTNLEVVGGREEVAAAYYAKTGITSRRYAPSDVTTSDLAEAAVRDMEQRFPGALEGVRWVIVSTSTPDTPQPPIAAVLQGRLGLTGVPAFDLNAVCAGFLAGLRVGAAMMADAAPHDRVLLVCADKYSPQLDPEHLGSRFLFGDGAGCVLLGKVPEPLGLHSLSLRSDGDLADHVQVTPTDEGSYFHMKGSAVTKYFLTMLPPLIREACADAAVPLTDVSAVICHQANPNLILKLTESMGIPPERVPLTAPEFGNTASASIPITLARAYDDGRLTVGDRVVFAAVGGGMMAGAGVLTWGGLLTEPEPPPLALVGGAVADRGSGA